MADQVRASHILLMYAGSERSTATRSKAEAQQQITELDSQLGSGADFAALAGQHSDCPSRKAGGDLGALLTVNSARRQWELPDGSAVDFHGIRIIYHVTVTGGELRDEADGSTDTCAWLSPAEIAQIPKVDLVDLALEILNLTAEPRT